MKYLLVFLALFLAGCTRLREGSCYATSNYSTVFKVTKALKYGAVLEVLKRDGTANLSSPASSQTSGYLSYESIQNEYFVDAWASCRMSAVQIDCEAYDKMKDAKP